MKKILESLSRLHGSEGGKSRDHLLAFLLEVEVKGSVVRIEDYPEFREIEIAELGRRADGPGHRRLVIRFPLHAAVQGAHERVKEEPLEGHMCSKIAFGRLALLSLYGERITLGGEPRGGQKRFSGRKGGGAQRRWSNEDHHEPDQKPQGGSMTEDFCEPWGTDRPRSEHRLSWHGHGPKITCQRIEPETANRDGGIDVETERTKRYRLASRRPWCSQRRGAA